MKPRHAWVTGLFLILVPGLLLAADPEPLSIEDVLRLHFAGVGDEVIISEIIVTSTVFELDVSDILRLAEAGLSDRLVKFMIDTKLTDHASTDEGDAEADYYLEMESGHEWVSVIEDEPEETTTYITRLNYNYGSWWYGSFWWDYWYWDCHYAPYRTGFVVSVGAWYPGWYSYGYCYSPAWYGYRNAYCATWGYPGYSYGYCDPYYYYGGSDYAYGGGLSQTKYKIGGSSGSGGGKYVAAGPKLDMGDGTRLTATKGNALATGRGVHKTRNGKELVVDRGPTRDPKRPTKTVGSPARPSGGRGVRTPTTSTQLADAKIRDAGRTPTRGVRSPASGGRPTKIRTPQRPTRTNTVTDRTRPAPGRTPSGARPSAPPPKTPTKIKPPTRSNVRVKPPSVRPAPRPTPKSSPARSTPARGGSKSGGGRKR